MRPDHDGDAKDRLFHRLARGQLLLLVGAGASRWAGLPSWREVVAALAGELVPALADHVPHAKERFRPPEPDGRVPFEALLRIPDAYRFLHGDERLVERIGALFDTSGVDPASLPLQQLLVRFAPFVPAIYTTNFDDLLERSLQATGRSCQVVAEARDLDAWQYDEIDGAYVPRFPVYKLHGSLDRPSTLVLGASDFQRRQGLASHPIDLRFCSDVVGREVLLVGYSFSDPNVRWLWTKLRDLGVLPVAHFLEVGTSTDLDVAYFLKDRVYRVDLRAADRERPDELVEFLDALLERCRRASWGRTPRPASPLLALTRREP